MTCGSSTITGTTITIKRFRRTATRLGSGRHVLPNIFYTFVGGNFPAVGPNFNAPQGRNTRRYELVEALSWQKGAHRLKFGGDLNPTRLRGFMGFLHTNVRGRVFAVLSGEQLPGPGGGLHPASLSDNSQLALKTDTDALNLLRSKPSTAAFSAVSE